jgi:hypothetical protein
MHAFALARSIASTSHLRLRFYEQKRPPGKARERRQRMGLSRFVESSTRFPVSVDGEEGS